MPAADLGQIIALLIAATGLFLTALQIARQRREQRMVRVVAWALLALGIGCMLAAEFLDSVTRPASNGTWWEDMLLIAAFVAFPAMGTLIALQRPDNAIGWLLLWVGAQ